jgi:hypothetical protein
MAHLVMIYLKMILIRKVGDLNRRWQTESHPVLWVPLGFCAGASLVEL